MGAMVLASTVVVQVSNISTVLTQVVRSLRLSLHLLNTRFLTLTLILTRFHIPTALLALPLGGAATTAVCHTLTPPIPRPQMLRGLPTCVQTGIVTSTSNTPLHPPYHQDPHHLSLIQWMLLIWIPVAAAKLRARTTTLAPSPIRAGTMGEAS